MSTDEPDPSKEDKPTVPAVGVGVGVGAGLGAAVFAITQDPAWIALGAAFGVVVGAVIQGRR